MEDAAKILPHPEPVEGPTELLQQSIANAPATLFQSFASRSPGKPRRLVQRRQ